MITVGGCFSDRFLLASHIKVLYFANDSLLFYSPKRNIIKMFLLDIRKH
jgi:hypothetical protein